MWERKQTMYACSFERLVTNTKARQAYTDEMGKYVTGPRLKIITVLKRKAIVFYSSAFVSKMLLSVQANANHISPVPEATLSG